MERTDTPNESREAEMVVGVGASGRPNEAEHRASVQCESRTLDVTMDMSAWPRLRQQSSLTTVARQHPSSSSFASPGSMSFEPRSGLPASRPRTSLQSAAQPPGTFLESSHMSSSHAGRNEGTSRQNSLSTHAPSMSRLPPFSRYTQQPPQQAQAHRERRSEQLAGHNYADSTSYNSYPFYRAEPLSSSDSRATGVPQADLQLPSAGTRLQALRRHLDATHRSSRVDSLSVRQRSHDSGRRISETNTSPNQPPHLPDPWEYNGSAWGNPSSPRSLGPEPEVSRDVPDHLGDDLELDVLLDAVPEDLTFMRTQLDHLARRERPDSGESLCPLLISAFS